MAGYTENELAQDLENQEYKFGFVTDIESDTVPIGLNEEIIHLISSKKNEPEWLLEYRLKAFAIWKTMTEPEWAHVHYKKPDFQAIAYYSAPKQTKKYESWDDVDPEMKETMKKLGISMEEQQRLTGVAVDFVMDSVSVATSFKDGLTSAGIDVATGKIPAVDAAVASGGVKAGMSALGGVMSNVPGMSGIADPTALASGVSNLPGGQSALSSIVNPRSLTTSGISDTLSGLNSITKNASSAALNQISTGTSGSSSVSGLLSGGALTGAGASLSGILSNCLLYTSPSPRDRQKSRMPSSA